MNGLSICIPTFNGAPFIRAALASAIAQIREPAEIVVVDDASTDDTAAVVTSFDDPRVRLVRNPRRLGIPGNWNRCLEVARGAYVNLLCQDDTLVPSALAHLGAALDAAPGAALAFGRRHLAAAPGMNYLSERYRAAAAGFHADCPPTVHGADLLASGLAAGRDPTLNVVGEPSFVLMRRQLALQVGGFDPQFQQLADWEMWLRLARQGPLAFVDEIVGVFRLHGASVSAQNFRSESARRESLRLLRRVADTYAPALPRGARRALHRVRWRHRLGLAWAVVSRERLG